MRPIHESYDDEYLIEKFQSGVDMYVTNVIDQPVTKLEAKAKELTPESVMFDKDEISNYFIERYQEYRKEEQLHNLKNSGFDYTKPPNETPSGLDDVVNVEATEYTSADLFVYYASQDTLYYIFGERRRHQQLEGAD